MSEEAISRIEEAAHTNAKELDLSDLALDHLPTSLSNLTNLNVLTLHNNQLTELPEWLTDLTNLTTIALGINRITELPESLGNLTNLTNLHLHKNQLAGLPESLGNLTNLTALSLNLNELTALPESLENLTNLTRLYIGDNQFTELPQWLSNLTNLTKIYIGDSRLTALPEWLSNLTNLTELTLHDNQLTALPESLENLTNLTTLSLDNNQLTALPETLSNLTNLNQLFISDNQLTELPQWLSNLTNLTTLSLDNNPLVSPPPEILVSGTAAILAFLRALQRGSEAQWASKMLVVGEAMVGKTSVAKALCGLEYDKSEPQTHGVHLDPLDLPHPSLPDTAMRLNVWDFGGQLEYRATQRFYLTDRSLFLLVWNSRQGWRTGGQVEAWLQAITTAAPNSPILVVATHCSSSVADLDENDLFTRYPQIRRILQVDCADGTGIDELRAEIARQAADLPLMGRPWPDTWTAAARELTNRPGRWISTHQADRLMIDHGLTDEVEHRALRAALHDRGDILHFAVDPQLSEVVVLKPAWVDEMITRVLDSRQVTERRGLLSRTHRAELWRDLDNPGLWDTLTVLMERFDLAYRIDAPGHEDVALLVERLPAGTPALPAEWEEILRAEGATQVDLTYRLSSRQAGVPSWFIAREHRYTTGIAWARGVLLRHHDHTAGPDGGSLRPLALLVDDDSAQPTIRLSVRGPAPHRFYSILDEAFTGILAERYPGLNVRRFIPCPCADGCGHEFPYQAAQRALERGKSLQCPETIDDVDPRTLLFGLRPFHLERDVSELKAGLGRLAQTTNRIERAQLYMLDHVRDLLRHRGEQGTRCPGIFTVVKTGRLTYEFRLYCEHPEGPHPLDDGAGVYELKRLPAGLSRYAPYLHVLLTGLLGMLPVVGSMLSGLGDIALTEEDRARLELSRRLLDDLGSSTDEPRPALERHHPYPDTDHGRRPTADFTELRQVLVELDPEKEWGGLRERELPESRGIVYLCHRHRQALHYPAQPPE
ncbi:COR domain-containing protein [Rhizohabitans arisaemae]|uniref:leucine-rich repeat domain-containing protein n=1 Tax=Rhizohabitans arisaemae TaxID=2720610 RepID=UPI0024B1A37D|nr:COR domain-containing protein [Rhizohabitans arisaemae]